MSQKTADWEVICLTLIRGHTSVIESHVFIVEGGSHPNDEICVRLLEVQKNMM